MEPRLESTGERMVEEHYRGSLGGYVIYLMHIASYRLAESYCRGKRVLDLGCGSGYGTARIAKVASHVQGVDVSEEAVAYARQRYPAANLAFDRIHADSALPFGDKTFDVVLSFQVIEHVSDDARYLAEAARVLADGGRLVLITPDRLHRLLPAQRPWNRWHLREYGMSDLQHLVSGSFNIEHALRMGAREEVAAIELRRYRLLKWLTLPLTFPGAPEAWRRAGLNMLQRFNPPRRASAEPFDPPFGEGAIQISSEVACSLNLVIVGSPHRLDAVRGAADGG